MKVKLIIIDSFRSENPNPPPKYFIEGDHIDSWYYSPECAAKQIQTVF